MFPEAILLTITEIAVALVGFSGVVAVFGRRAKSSWGATEIIRLRTLVEPSLFVLFASLVPGTFQLATQSDALTWQLTSATFGVLELIGLAQYLLRTRSVKTTNGQRILTLLSFVVLGALWLSAFGVIPDQALVCVLALIHGLLVGAYNFTLLLFDALEE